MLTTDCFRELLAQPVSISNWWRVTWQTQPLMQVSLACCFGDLAQGGVCWHFSLIISAEGTITMSNSVWRRTNGDIFQRVNHCSHTVGDSE